MTRRRIILLVVGFILLIVVGGALWLVWKHTAFLRPSPTPEQVQENNQGTNTTVNENTAQPTNTNPPTNQNTNTTTTTSTKLAKTTVVVPQQFRRGAFASTRTLLAPEGVTVSVFAGGMSEPRFFIRTPEGALVVADKGAGKILLLPDENSDGIADRTIEVDKGLNTVHSVWLDGTDLYSGEEDQVVVYREFTSAGTFSKKEILVPNLPDGGGHSTRTVVVGPDRKLYVSVGSSCNVCVERDERRATVMQYDLDGSNGRVFAKGLRNSVGIAFRGQELWGVDMGRDLIGDNLPPEELNRIELGKHYGWPYCYGDQVANPEYASRAVFCKNDTAVPAVNMQAHSAPLGLAVIPENSVVGGRADSFITAFHGSWNRTVPTGYKVVRIDPENARQGSVNVLSGWLDDGGNVWGRPVGVVFAPDGTLFVSDDHAGVIYRVSRPAP